MLGSEYDRIFLESSKVPLNLTRRDKRFKEPAWPHDYSPDVDVEVDMPHTSLATAVRLNPLKFSPAFRSTAKSGFILPTPTSGVDIGPGYYPGAQRVTQAVSIKGPGTGDLSVVYRSKLPKTTPTRLAIPDYNLRANLPTLLEKNGGFVFAKTGASGAKNNFLAEWTAAKISKIYPKFQGGKYAKSTKVEGRRISSGKSAH